MLHTNFTNFTNNDNDKIVHCIDNFIPNELLSKIENHMNDSFVDKNSLNMMATRYRFISPEIASNLAILCKQFLDINKVMLDMRIIDYDVGGDIKIHHDGYQVEDNLVSTHTFILYLNDSENEGTTDFFTGLDGEKCWCSIKPKRGKMIIFKHKIAHKGQIVYNKKTLLRGDMILI